MVRAKKERSETVLLILTTYGGMPHEAYRMAKALLLYDDRQVLIAGRCKSAGTLVALVGNELIFGPWGELGPLDTQIRRPDEIDSYHSGLDALETLSILRDNGYDIFELYLLRLIDDLGMSTKQAAEISASLTSGILQPISSQVDPNRVSESSRAIQVARVYGEKLESHNLKSNALGRLIEDYPSHSFVIDRDEAAELFESVRGTSEHEQGLVDFLEDEFGIIRYPRSGQVVLDVSQTLLELDAVDILHSLDSDGPQLA